MPQETVTDVDALVDRVFEARTGLRHRHRADVRFFSSPDATNISSPIRTPPRREGHSAGFS